MYPDSVLGNLEDTYPLYCIHYDGIYLEPTSSEAIASIATNNNNPRPISNSFKYIVQQRIVNRRFREFLNLQSRLEGNQKLKTLVKAIKGKGRLFLNQCESRLG